MEFTEEERKKLAEFKEKVEEILPYDYAKTDLYLIRWLRARDLNIFDAEKMLRNHMQWRKVNKIDLLLEGPPDSFFTKNYPYWLNGVDRKGQPVLCSPVGTMDIRRIVEEDRIKEFEDYITRMYERVLEAIRKANERRDPEQPPITQFTLILNWDKFSVLQTANIKGTFLEFRMINILQCTPNKREPVWNRVPVFQGVAVQTLANISAVYETHYPEILSQAFFLNTNQFFQIVFALMKPILARRTLSKVTCFGTNRDEWEPVVRSVVEEHQIPRQFGG